MNTGAEQPLVSIIMPCYNKQDYIEEALASVERQSYPNWEVVLVDDGSPDDTIGIALRYTSAHLWKKQRVVVLRQENQGPSVARNNGIQHSHGKYILPLDPDDTIAPTYIEKAVATLEAQPDITLVYCLSESITSEPYSFDKLIWFNMIHNSAIYRRADYDCTTGYNPNMRKGLEDWDFYLSLLSPESVVVRLDEVMLFCHTSDDSRTTDADAHERELMRLIYNNHPQLYAPHIQDIVFYREKWFHDAESINQLRQSHAYRLGKKLLKPLQWLRSKQD